MKPGEEIEIRSENVQEILSYIPHWIIRWGITIIFSTIFLLLLIAWVIKYPEIITSRITVTTPNPPVSVIARSSGKFILSIKENDFVESDTYLAAIDNPADIEHIFQLKKKLNSFNSFIMNPNEIPYFDFDENAKLGELQDVYSVFLQNYMDYRFFAEDNYHINKIKSINNQIGSYNDLNYNLVSQKDILSNEVELAKKKFDNETLLFEKGHISETNLSNTKSIYLQKKHTLESAQGNIIRNNIQLTEYQKTIMDLNQQYRERKRELVFSIQESYKKLLSQLAIWEQKYILKAPIDGHVSFFKFWSDNQFINAGDEVMAIVPNSQDIIGKIYVPAMGSGKIKTGQEVRIKFDSYPFNEFGAVEGEINSISLISRDNVYLINVNLPNGLTTNYNKDLEFKQEMQGTADIITEDLRLSERIFNQLRYILSSTVDQ